VNDYISLLKQSKSKIAELEKTLREFEHAVRNENELLEMQKNQDIRDLEQQAKALFDYACSTSALTEEGLREEAFTLQGQADELKEGKQ
jgi:hypothetical protein